MSVEDVQRAFEDTKERIESALDATNDGTLSDEDASAVGDSIGDLTDAVTDTSVGGVLRAAGFEDVPENVEPGTLLASIQDADAETLVALHRLLELVELGDSWSGLDDEARVSELERITSEVDTDEGLPSLGGLLSSVWDAVEDSAESAESTDEAEPSEVDDESTSEESVAESSESDAAEAESAEAEGEAPESEEPTGEPEDDTSESDESAESESGKSTTDEVEASDGDTDEPAEATAAANSSETEGDSEEGEAEDETMATGGSFAKRIADFRTMLESAAEDSGESVAESAVEAVEDAVSDDSEDSESDGSEDDSDESLLSGRDDSDSESTSTTHGSRTHFSTMPSTRPDMGRSTRFSTMPKRQRGKKKRKSDDE